MSTLKVIQTILLIVIACCAVGVMFIAVQALMYSSIPPIGRFGIIGGICLMAFGISKVIENAD